MIFWDACAIIYFVEGASPWAERLFDTLEALRQPNQQHAISQLSILECRIKPRRERDDKTLARYDHFFSRTDLIIAPISSDVLARATDLRAFTGLKTPDAIQAATALALSQNPVFITNDASFARVAAFDLRLLT